MTWRLFRHATARRRVIATGEWESSTAITSFASDSEVTPQDVTPIPETLSLVPGIEHIRAGLAESRAKARADVAKAKTDVEVLPDMASPWSGQAAKLDWVLREVTKRHAKISGGGARMVG